MAGVLALCLVLLFTDSGAVIYAAVGLMGFGMACVFATFYSVATRAVPERANEVAGLMILAISAGAVSGPACGAVARAAGSPHWGDALRRRAGVLHALGERETDKQRTTDMKKIVLTLLLAAAAWSVAAQRPRTRVEWGVIGGISIPDYTTDMDRTDIRNKCGWQAGIVTAVNLGAFAVEPQILYVRQGMRIRRGGRGGEPQVQFDRRAGAAVAAAAPSRAHLHRTGLYGDERQQAEVGGATCSISGACVPRSRSRSGPAWC